jgi:hypothetical protein
MYFEGATGDAGGLVFRVRRGSGEAGPQPRAPPRAGYSRARPAPPKPMRFLTSA